jgi:hypothetical protein
MSAAGSFFKAVCSASKVFLFHLAAGDEIGDALPLADVLLVGAAAMIELVVSIKIFVVYGIGQNTILPMRPLIHSHPT